MEKFTTSLITEMTVELQKIAISAENQLQLAEQSFYEVEGAMTKLKEYITSYAFKNIEEEIKFFKELKPEFQKELIFYEEILYIESGKPVGSEKARKRYLEQLLNRIQGYCDKNKYFYNYYRSGETAYDKHYFVRNAIRIPLVPVSYSDIDSSFSTPYSYKLAKLQAMDKLMNHIKSSLKATIDISEIPTTGQNKNRRRRVWTGPKSALKELILAMDAKGWVSHGEGGVKQLVIDFEEFFGTDLGNIYRELLAMALRKKGYTPHLDGLKEALEIRIKEKHE
ncbi:RteC domain-containing protein [Pedobacter sp. B4-66]|uniref:RteC domain-containing protein n=1 Tax=Pedobacter sp. B4-66 TaxID=2817280 RepID=UPI001BD9571F|nr:RteC domain-containing protein [Pedobacter sp. B4-66]